MAIDEFLDWAKAGHWKRVVSELETGRYQPSPVRRVEIDKPDGSKRPLGIPCIVDRVIQQAIAQVHTPLFDPDFSESSFGFRPRRSAKQAVMQVHSIIKSGRRFAIETAVACGRTSKGPCRSAKTPGIQQALSNAYLKAEGLYSLRQGWISLHHSV